ncbi:helix-turn-helix transcriptional regulator [Robbsia sp. Bb-Pol-6]|uniref:Helix-turn-helix transcriptional regulator n=1 Tax=Robbsia betulipollinis TaxID=2981849 RepID=A0ABT3ZJK4_9BURK|nr:helix-turn-helix transcriptional regulator [Robbsia betulipollinis]MCY0386522.1 helix-turn-helix transcriptional regulator [Robbsia betulipollinis]
MRNIPLDALDAIARPVLAIGTDYPKGTLLDTHRHRRAQFLYGATGLMEVGTDDGAWVIPPHTGVWIPAGKPHRVRMVGVTTRSLYIAPRCAPRKGTQCEVLKVSPLLHAMLMDAVDVPALYDRRGRDGALMQLLLHEVARAPALPFFAPIPREAGLAALCLAFLHAPQIRTSPQSWARRLHRSDRTFSRQFRQETGMAFGEWRQQACLLAALSRLSAGHGVTEVALELGYDSPGAFSTMFRRKLGMPPSLFPGAARFAARR